MDPIENLARHAVNVQLDQVPARARAVAKLSLLDTLGTLLAGAEEEGCRELLEQVREWGGRPESTVLIHGDRVPAHNAALVNSVMARALDFDDAIDKGMHVGAGLNTAALAVAEREGGASGAELLMALVVGADVACRLNAAVVSYPGFDPTLTCGVFGFAVAAGRLMRLDEGQMANALGLAFNQAAGSFQSNVDGVLSVRLNQGLASSAGIVSALLARRGITGVRNVLGGHFGFFQLFARGKMDAEHLSRGLGEEFYGARLMFKRWPSCGATLSATDAVVEMVEREGVRAEEVEEIVATVSPHVHGLVGHPFQIGANPTVNGQFSLQYTLANVLLRGRPHLEHFMPDQVRDEAVGAMARRVRVVVDNAVPRERVLGADVELRLYDGRSLRLVVPIMRGHATNPLDDDEIRRKFLDNNRFSAHALAADQAERLMDLVDRVDEVEDARALVSLLRPE